MRSGTSEEVLHHVPQAFLTPEQLGSPPSSEHQLAYVGASLGHLWQGNFNV